MDHHLRAARIGHRIVAEERGEPAAAHHGKDRAHLDLDILGKGLDLGPGAAARIRLDADVRQIEHQQVRQVDQHHRARCFFSLLIGRALMTLSV